jgi:hypothetical protein
MNRGAGPAPLAPRDLAAGAVLVWPPDAQPMTVRDGMAPDAVVRQDERLALLVAGDLEGRRRTLGPDLVNDAEDPDRQLAHDVGLAARHLRQTGFAAAAEQPELDAEELRHALEEHAALDVLMGHGDRGPGVGPEGGFRNEVKFATLGLHSLVSLFRARRC